ncbi:hypothetical protein L1887_58176 [Cichorium endivia]|nr:hypothetical protein L1887_58176 [Cichorium endivia]
MGCSKHVGESAAHGVLRVTRRWGDGSSVSAGQSGGRCAAGVVDGLVALVVGPPDGLADTSEGAEERLAGGSASKVGLDKDEHRWQLTSSYKRLSRVEGHRNGLSSFGRSVQWSRKGKEKGALNPSSLAASIAVVILVGGVDRGVGGVCGDVGIGEGSGQVGLRYCGNHVWCGRVDRRWNHVLVVDGIGGWCRAVWVEVGLDLAKLLKASAPDKGEWERMEGEGDCYRGSPSRGIGSAQMVRIAREQLDSRYPDGLVDVWLSGRGVGEVGGRLMKVGASPPKKISGRAWVWWDRVGGHDEHGGWSGICTDNPWRRCDGWERGRVMDVRRGEPTMSEAGRCGRGGRVTLKLLFGCKVRARKKASLTEVRATTASTARSINSALPNDCDTPARPPHVASSCALHSVQPLHYSSSRPTIADEYSSPATAPGLELCGV